MIENLKKIEGFTAALKDNKLSVDDIIKKYCLTSPNIKKDTEEYQKIRSNLFHQIITMMKTDTNEKNVKILSWNYAEKIKPNENNDILEGEQSQNNVFVMFVDDTPTYYINTKGNKIQSLSPMLKGDLIIGWI